MNKRTNSADEIQSRIAANEVNPHPCCPICGSECYEEVKKNNGILGPGGRAWVIYCVCSNCSVMFKEPDKFFRSHK